MYELHEEIRKWNTVSNTYKYGVRKYLTALGKALYKEMFQVELPELPFEYEFDVDYPATLGQFIYITNSYTGDYVRAECIRLSPVTIGRVKLHTHVLKHELIHAYLAFNGHANEGHGLRFQRLAKKHKVVTMYNGEIQIARTNVRELLEEE
jgi:hypothetical protein